MPELTLTQAPAHVRHGSSIGQPLTRRDGVLKVTGAATYAAITTRLACSMPSSPPAASPVAASPA